MQCEHFPVSHQRQKLSIVLSPVYLIVYRIAYVLSDDELMVSSHHAEVHDIN